MKIQLIASVLLSSHMSTMVSSYTRIVGGEEVDAGKFSYAVSFQAQDWLSSKHFCGGSLISRDVVLSAAHCGPIGSSNKAVIGRLDLGVSEGEAIRVGSSVSHPDYDDSKTDNDFMLVFLEEPAQDKQFVKLNSDVTSPTSGDPVTVVGWGTTSQGGPLSDVLLAVELNAMSNGRCSASTFGSESYWGQITDNMLCASDDGEDSCQGDSGGPLVVESSDGSADVQVGVVSWGYGCAHPEFAGVYSRVSSAYEWIKKEVCSRSSYPSAEFDCDSDSIEEVVGSKPAPSPSYTQQCTDTSNWVDGYGDGCEWYEKNDISGCPSTGDYGVVMGLAKNHCCWCVGTASAPVPSPVADSSTDECWGGFSNFACCYFSLWC